MDDEEVYVFDTDVFGSTVGFVVLGLEHDAATMKADPSPLTLGIFVPLIETV